MLYSETESRSLGPARAKLLAFLLRTFADDPSARPHNDEVVRAVYDTAGDPSLSYNKLTTLNNELLGDLRAVGFVGDLVDRANGHWQVVVPVSRVSLGEPPQDPNASPIPEVLVEEPTGGAKDTTWPAFSWRSRTVGLALLGVGMLSAGIWYATARSHARSAQGESVSARPGAYRVLIADLDQDCNISQRRKFTGYLSKQLNDIAQEQQLSLEIRRLDRALNADEPGALAVQLLKSENAQVLIWGGYSCTRTDVEFDFRLAARFDGQREDSDLLSSGPRQDSLRILDNLHLHKFTAKSLSGSLLLALGLIEVCDKHFQKAEGLGSRSITSFRTAIASSESIDSKPERTGLAIALTVSVASRLAQLTSAERQITEVGNDSRKLAELQDQLDEALTLAPDSDIAHSLSGVVQLGMGTDTSRQKAAAHLRRAIEHFNSAMRIGPTLPFVRAQRLMTIGLLARTTVGDEHVLLIDDALQVCRDEFTKKQRDPLLIHECVAFWIQPPDLETGVAALRLHRLVLGIFSDAASANPNDYEAHLARGRLIAHRANKEVGRVAQALLLTAIDLFKMTAPINPKDPRAYREWAFSLRDLGRRSGLDDAERYYAESQRQFSTARRLDPRDSYIVAQLGFNGSELADRRESVCKKPVRISSCPTLGELYAAADHHFAESLKLSPQSYIFHARGQLLAKWGSKADPASANALYEQAAVALRGAHARDADNPFVCRDLANVLDQLASSGRYDKQSLAVEAAALRERAQRREAEIAKVL